MHPHQYLRQRDAARSVRVSLRTMERWRRDGTGPEFIRAGRRILYRRADIEAWLATRTFRSTAEADEARHRSATAGPRDARA